MKPSLLNLLLGLLFITSCSNPNLKTNGKKETASVILPYRVEIEANLKNFKSVSLSSVGKEIEYIPLETTPKSLMRRITQICFSDSYIFISDMYKLLQFDRNGKFIRQVGSIGRGPGEYVYVMGFCIDESKKVISIKDYSNPLVKEYNFDGNFIRSFKIPFESTQFLVKDRDSYIFHLANGTHMDEDSYFSLYITDLNGTPNVKIRKSLVRSSKYGISVGKTPLYFIDSTLRFLEYGIDTLFSLKDTKLEPYAILSLGHLKMDPDPFIPQNNGEREMLNRLKEKLWINDILENDQNLFIKLNYGLSDLSEYVVFNKSSQTTTFLKNGGFVNDIDGGLTNWPKYMYNDSIFVDYCDANIFKNEISGGNSEEMMKKYGEKYLRLKRVVSGIDEMSNPVLIILKTK